MFIHKAEFLALVYDEQRDENPLSTEQLTLSITTKPDLLRPYLSLDILLKCEISTSLLLYLLIQEFNFLARLVYNFLHYQAIRTYGKNDF